MSRTRWIWVATALMVAPVVGCGAVVPTTTPPTASTLPPRPSGPAGGSNGLGDLAPFNDDATTTVVTTPAGTPEVPSTVPPTKGTQPRWCGLTGCSPSEPRHVDVAVPKPAPGTPEYCTPLTNLVNVGYKLYELRLGGSSDELRVAAHQTLDALEVFTSLAQDQELSGIADKYNKAIAQMDTFPRDVAPATVLDFLVPRANEISLVIQRIIDKQECPGL